MFFCGSILDLYLEMSLEKRPQWGQQMVPSTRLVSTPVQMASGVPSKGDRVPHQTTKQTHACSLQTKQALLLVLTL